MTQEQPSEGLHTSSGTIVRASELAVVGANGGGWVADLGTPAPWQGKETSYKITPPRAPWAGMGAISDDGLAFGFDEDTKDFTPWGMAAPFKTVITKSARTFKITLWETANPVARSLMYRIPVDQLTPVTDGQFVSFAETASPSSDTRAFYFIVLDGDNAEGFYVPHGEVTDRSDVAFKNEAMAGFELTITAHPDSANNTVYHGFLGRVPGDRRSA